MTREEAISILHGIRADNLNFDDLYTKDKYNALSMAIKALEQEPCEDAISRQAVLDKKELVELEDGQSFYCISPEDVETLPSVTPQRRDLRPRS